MYYSIFLTKKSNGSQLELGLELRLELRLELQLELPLELRLELHLELRMEFQLELRLNFFYNFCQDYILSHWPKIKMSDKIWASFNSTRQAKIIHRNSSIISIKNELMK